MKTIPWANGGKKCEERKTDGKRHEVSDQEVLGASYFSRENRQKNAYLHQWKEHEVGLKQEVAQSELRDPRDDPGRTDAEHGIPLQKTRILEVDMPAHPGRDGGRKGKHIEKKGGP